jgi:hypothetical protein
VAAKGASLTKIVTLGLGPRIQASARRFAHGLGDLHRLDADRNRPLQKVDDLLLAIGEAIGID